MDTVKITFISDTHGLHNKLDMSNYSGDILVHCGDLSNIGGIAEISRFVEWFENIPNYKHKIFIAGNHDLALDGNYFQIKDLAENVHYLENSEVEVMGLTFWGSPITPRFYDWAFMKTRGAEIKSVWRKMPHNTDILVTHGPPFGILDATVNGVITGCFDLLEEVKHKQPIVHSFGHIHESYGVETIDPHWNVWATPTTFVNASIANANYDVVNKPITLIVNPESRRVINIIK